MLSSSSRRAWARLQGIDQSIQDAPVRQQAPQNLRQIIPQITAEIKVWSPGKTSAGTETPALTPAQLELRTMVLNSVTSPHSRRTYAKGLDLLFAFAASRPLTRALLMEYRTSMEDLAPSTVNVRLAAGRKMVTEAKRNGLLSAEEASSLTDVPNIRQSGTRLGNWLSKEQARELLAVPDRSTVKGKRDYAILAVLVSCALRRKTSFRTVSCCQFLAA